MLRFMPAALPGAGLAGAAQTISPRRGGGAEYIDGHECVVKGPDGRYLVLRCPRCGKSCHFSLLNSIPIQLRFVSVPASNSYFQCFFIVLSRIS